MFRNKSKFFICYCIIFYCFSLKVNAQYQHTISAGVGFPNIPRLTSDFFKGNNGYTSKGNGPYHLKYENRINNWLAAGLSINYMDYEVRYIAEIIDNNGIKRPNNVKIESRSTAFNARANFHLLNNENIDNWDLYIGLGLGFKSGNFKVSSDYEEFTPKITLPRINPIGAEFTFGARYFFFKNIGIYTELGIAKSIIQTGIVGRF